MKTKKIYLDIETGGANPLLNPILEVTLRDKDTDKTFTSFIRPEQNKCIEQQALDYNGIDIEECYRKGVKLRTILDHIDFCFFEDASLIYLIGHKIKFDFEFLRQACIENNKKFPSIVLIDTKELMKEADSNLFVENEYVNQKMIYKHLFGEEPYQRENKSLSDIDMTQRIYEHLEDL